MLEIGFLYYFGLLEEGFEFVSNNCVAIKMIDEWLEENVNVIKDFTNIIREKLYFIWYEMRDVNNTAMELEFKNINFDEYFEGDEENDTII